MDGEAKKKRRGTTISIDSSIPLLLTNENEDEMIEHDGEELCVLDSTRIIGLLMN